MKRIATALALALVAPLLIAATDPAGDLVACDGSGAVTGGGPDIVGVEAAADELGSVAVWRLHFPEPLRSDAINRDDPIRVVVLVRDPRVRGVTIGGYPGVNRIVSWVGTAPDAPVRIRLVPEHSTTPFNAPVIDGATLEIRIPGRLLVGEAADGSADVGRARWRLIVRQGDACDEVGRGVPSLRFSAAEQGSVTAPPGSPPPAGGQGGLASQGSGVGRAMLVIALSVFVVGALAFGARKRWTR